MSDEPPADVRQLIVDHINSVEQLEVLLLVRGQPDRDWDAPTVGQALYTPAAAAATRLEDLQSRGFLTITDGSQKLWRYRPNSVELERLVDSLAETYRQRRVSVISLIYSKPHQQIQAFADAFKFWKDK